jgi:hypothetical protein
MSIERWLPKYLFFMGGGGADREKAREKREKRVEGKR